MKDIPLLFVMCIFLTNIVSAQNSKVLKNVKKYEKPAQAKAAKSKLIEIPEPISNLTYLNPVKQFNKLKGEWLESSYKKTIEESNPKKDTSTYTAFMHLEAYKSSVDFNETYDFDLAQYVSYTDWNNKYHFMTLYFDTNNGHTGIEFLDSLMTRHYFVCDNKSKIMLHKATDRKGVVTIFAIPIAPKQEFSTDLTDVWPLADVKKQKQTKDKPKILGKEYTETIIGTSFNHASIKHTPISQKYARSLINNLTNLLPPTVAYMVQSINEPKNMILEINATYGDKPFYTCKWKTLKINASSHSLSMATTNNK